MHLKDQDLNEKVKSLAAQERKLTKEILLHIAEVDKRKLFLKMAYSSLFDYLTKEIGYSFGAAQRRIDSARLMHKVPEVSDQIEDGSLHLSQISKVQKICRHIKKESGMAVEVATQKAVLKKLENKTSEQTDLILAQEFQMKVKTIEKKVIQKDESVRLELTLTKEEMELLNKARELLSNKTGGSLKNTLIEMAERTIKSYQPRTKSNQPKRKEKATSTTAMEVEEKINVNVTAVVAAEKQNNVQDSKELKSVTPKLKSPMQEP